MDQIREQVLQVLDKQQVLSRLKAELRANVFLAINDQDIRQGGIGLGSKSDATHRNHLAADPTGVLLLELVRELLQWCNLQFTQKVYEQEMQLGPAAALETLQKQLGSAVDTEVNQPLLLQLLQHVVGSLSPSWQAPTAQADVSRKQLPGTKLQQAAADATSRRSFALPVRQLQRSAAAAAAAPEAAAVAAEDKTATAAQSEAEVCTVSAAASKSTLLLGAASVAEDSSLIGTHQDEEEEEYATVLLPKHRTSSGNGLDDEASSASSTYPVDTPRITARPVRAPAVAAAGQQSSLRPLGQHPPLPPLAAMPPAEPAVSDYAAGGWDSQDGSGMAAACELSESFGHDRSFGESSLELQGLDSPPHGAAAAGVRAAAAAIDGEASYSSGASSSSSKGGSSRALSPADVDVSGAGAQQVASVPGGGTVRAASLEPLPAARAPGKLAPLPPVGGVGAAGSSIGTGVTKRNSEGVRNELLRSGLLAPQPPAAAPAQGRSAQQPLRAEASADSYRADSESWVPGAATAAARAGARVSDDSLTCSSLADSQDLGSWHGTAAAAAAAAAAVVPQQPGTAQRADSLEQECSQQQSDAGSGSDSDEDSEDDFGVRGQQQLLAAARQQLSNRSRSDAQGADQQGLGQLQQQQQGHGGMLVEVSGASLILTCSADLDEDTIPEDISLPIDALIDGCDDSALFEPAQPAGGQAQAWGSSTRTAAGAGGTAGTSVGKAARRGAQQTLELTHDGSDSDKDQPLAVGAGFSIDDDDF